MQAGDNAGYGLFMAPGSKRVSCGGRPWWKPWGAPPPHPTVASFPLSSIICAQNIGADPQVCGGCESSDPAVLLPLHGKTGVHPLYHRTTLHALGTHTRGLASGGGLHGGSTMPSFCRQKLQILTR